MPFNVPSFTVAFIAEALSLDRTSSDLVFPSGGPKEFRAIVTDSRAVQPGDLFVALRGDRFDGHEFIADVVKRGAAGVLCARGFAGIPAAPGTVFFRVEDTLAALRKIAGRWRDQFQLPVVAVAGSVGKTTTKELIAACLRGRYKRVLKTEASQNGFLGVALTLLRLSPSDEAAVIEIGIDAPAAMQQHLDLVRPTVSVVTALGEEHLETLKDMDTVAREEGLALTWVGARGGVVAFNADEPWLTPLATHGSLKGAIRFSLGDLAPRNGDFLWGQLDGTHTVSVSGHGFHDAFFPVPLPGVHNARNLLAAIAVAVGMGLSETQIRTGLATFEAPQGRSQVVELEGSVRVLCDYYNASPSSMRAGLELLSTMAKRKGGTAWACLADMLELGPEELRYHRELAEPILKGQAGVVVLAGPRMKALYEELKKKKMPGHLDYFKTVDALATEVAGAVKAGDTVLIKGSRGMKMEQVLAALEAKRPRMASTKR